MYRVTFITEVWRGSLVCFIYFKATSQFKDDEWCQFDSTKDWNSSFLPRFSRATTAISFTVYWVKCINSYLDKLILKMWYWDHDLFWQSFSPDNPCKCESRCIKGDSFYFLRGFFFLFFQLKLNKAFWLNLFRPAQWLTGRTGVNLTPTMTGPRAQSQMGFRFIDLNLSRLKGSLGESLPILYLSTLTETYSALWLTPIVVIWGNG